jgi:hypothetical protein
MILEFEAGDLPDVLATPIDPDGEDVRSMELNRFYTADEMRAMGYGSTHDEEPGDEA